MKTKPHFKLCALAAFLLVGIAGCSKKAAEKTGVEGNWTGFDMARPAEVCKVMISGNQLEYRGAQSNDWCTGTFVLDETAEPKTMDLTIQGPQEIAGRTMLLIYEQQGDEMKVAGAQPGAPVRPVDFSLGQQTRVWSFKRD
jgi:uncharacterized protein (TIGR03067 family)